MSTTPVVHIIDDDEAVRDALSLLLDTLAIDNRTYPDAQAFLSVVETPAFKQSTGCIVLDVRMPVIGGLECQQRLKTLGIEMPVIFITGHGDVPMAVEAMKRGAAEFIQKPFREQELLDAIQRAVQQDRQRFEQANAQTDTQTRLGSLTPREREVLEAVVAGNANKVIAADLNLSQRTVEIHRAKVMEKMQVKTLAALVRMMVELDQSQN